MKSAEAVGQPLRPSQLRRQLEKQAMVAFMLMRFTRPSQSSSWSYCHSDTTALALALALAIGLPFTFSKLCGRSIFRRFQTTTGNSITITSCRHTIYILDAPRTVVPYANRFKARTERNSHSARR